MSAADTTPTTGERRRNSHAIAAAMNSATA